MEAPWCSMSRSSGGSATPSQSNEVVRRNSSLIGVRFARQDGGPYLTGLCFGRMTANLPSTRLSMRQVTLLARLKRSVNDFRPFGRSICRFEGSESRPLLVGYEDALKALRHFKED